MVRSLLISVLCSISFCIVIGQEEAAIDEVVIIGTNKKDNSLELKLNSKRIQNKIASDLGKLMSLFPGVQVKNYGDVGGLKTVSFRSLGAGHSALVQDFSSVSNTQSGQSDLSNIPVDFIQNVSLIALSPTTTDIPIHAKLSGVVISCESVHSYTTENNRNILIGGQIGSFDHYEIYSMLAYRSKKKFATAATGKFRTYGGSFPFMYKNGNLSIHERRKNNRLLEYFGTWSMQFKPTEKHTFQARFSANKYQKELAGAVVFYNSNAQQYLNGFGYNVAINHRYHENKWQVFSTANFQQNNLQYLDSSYLNTLGYLDQRYLSHQIDFQTQANYTLSKKIDLLFGSSFISEKLQAKSMTHSPYRNSSETLLGLKVHVFNKINFLVQLGTQGIFEKRDSILKQNWYFLPAGSIVFHINSKHAISTSYRYTNRQPSFSELYYQQMGNTKLRTEKAHIASFQYNYSVSFNNGMNQFIIQPFYTYIYDKILAIPTKNLFIWSIQNIGKSDAIGLELVESLQKTWGKHTAGFRINYTFQYTQDLSNPTASTYRNQLSYSPLNSGSVELNYAWENLNFFILNSYLGQRYALNQNIPSNLLDAYYLLDIGGGYKLNVKRNEISVRFTVNNLTNKQYYYINYFVMPGINYNIRLQYAF